MSDAAIRDREVKRHWAEPGSRHDLLVKAAKVGLPSAVGVLVAFLALAPLAKDSEVSFILDKNQVDTAPERMRVESARYVGRDDKGQPWVISARRAIQQSSDRPIVDINGMFARLDMQRGPAAIQAPFGRYNLDTQKVAIPGMVRVSGPEGQQLATRDVLVDLNTRTITSGGAVSGEMPVGQFNAGELRADLGQKKVALSNGVSGQVELGQFIAGRMRADLESRTVILNGGARLKITQGAVR
ncbi:LPS export ABC transporter periplasmic protein LptC [Sphingomonas sp. GCM10030256]|uniref:LPS export ABC transporter periplasmic protein LptC n=1 Tax=Sphingomonas sp. GCM10030256 TaxID=3273427 RepID=UPI00361EC518